MSSPLLYVWHYRRKTFSQFLEQIKNYGFGRGQLLYSCEQKKKLLPAAVALAVIIFTYRFPIISLNFLSVWVVLIFFNYFANFKNKSVLSLLLPFRVWINYCVGIINGLWFSYRNIR